MLNAIFGTSIRSLVIKSIDNVIDNAQQEYDEGVIKIDEEAKTKKEYLANTLVEGIIRKISQ